MAVEGEGKEWENREGLASLDLSSLVHGTATSWDDAYKMPTWSC